MAEIGDDEQVENWRQYYENPLTVATTAMLHIHGDQNSSQNQYEIYKEEPMDSPTGGGTLELKLANNAAEGTIRAEHVESIFLQGGAEGVKREPEDLTRKCISPIDRGVLSDKRRLVPVSSHSGSPPALIPTQSLKDALESGIKDESTDRPRANHTIIIQAPLDSGDKMSGYLSTFAAASPQSNYETVQYLAQSPQPYTTSTSPAIPRSSSAYPAPGDQYYREYYPLSADQYAIRQEYNTEVAFDRYPRPAASYRTILTVDSSPDSGISSDTLSSKEQVVNIPQQTFTYEELNQPTLITGDLRPVAVSGSSPGAQRGSPVPTPVVASRSWHDFSRHSETDKIQIPKLHSDDDKIYIEKIESNCGFKYYFESPISTSPRKEDDRITYINKGQFYAITMEYIPDPERIRKPGLVKSVIMLLFREEKSSEDERKAWHFWHSRQHSVKQRILDIDTKNSVGIAGCVEEVSHNAIAVYWNPMESSAKVNVAVQCLSTDFSSQKGVKGLPLHIQIDTYEEVREPNSPITHRGYCQIKVFCDKGAERKTRDEERRAQKRRMNPSTRKKYEDLYHASSDRSEFYSMADLIKEPVLFKPTDDIDKVSYMTGMEIQGSFYTHDTENGVCGQNIGTGMDVSSPISPQHIPSPTPSLRASLATNTSPSPMVATHVPSSVCSPPPPNVNSQENISFTTLSPLQPTVSPKINNLRFHNSISQQYGDFHKDINQSISNGNNIGNNNMDEIFSHAHKRTRLTPPLNERVMIYVRRESEEIYTPLHLIPPVTHGLLNAIEQKYQIPRANIKSIIRINKSGIRARMDDDMLSYYCNEECFIIDIHHREQDAFEVTLTELSMSIQDQ